MAARVASCIEVSMTLSQQSVPLQFQQWLQQLYCLPALAPVDDFLIEGRAVNGPTETLLLREVADTLQLGLYLDPEVVARIEARGGVGNFPEQSLQDFWIVLEGVSHFVCLGWHAERDREISALDLEIQAEIDKYVTAWELARQCGLGDIAERLHEQLFSCWRLDEGVEAAVAERYVRASETAARYCRYLRACHGNSLSLRAELRTFFRLPPRRRRERIAHLSAR